MTDGAAMEIMQSLGETAESINEVALVGTFGFLRVEGPFLYEKQGTMWAVSMDTDDLPTPLTYITLLDAAGKCAVAVADGEIIAGGIVEKCVEHKAHDELHLVVDQYAMGDS